MRWSGSAAIPRSRRCWRRSSSAFRPRSTSRTPCSAAPIGCWRAASRGSPPASPRPPGCARPTAAAPSIPATRCGRRSSRSPAAEYRPPQPGAPIELLITRRQPGGADLRRDRAAGPGRAAAGTARRACGSASRRAPRICDRVAAQLNEAGIAAEISSFFTDVPDAAGARAAGDLPLRRLDDRRAGGRRPAGAAGALSARDRRSPDRECPRLRRGRRGLGHPAAGLYRADAGPNCSASCSAIRAALRARGGAGARASRRDDAADRLARLVLGLTPSGPGSPARSAPHEIAAGFDRPDPFRRDRRHRHERHRRGAAQSRLPGAGQRSGRQRQYPPARRARHPGQDRPRRRRTSTRPRSS